MEESPTRRRRFWFRLLLLALIGAAALREAGWLDLNLYRSRSKLSFSHSPLNLQSLEGRVASWTLTESNDGWNAFLATSDGTSYQLEIDARLGEIEGAYWAPFYKRGSCRFEFTVSCAALELRQPGGAGAIELTLQGLASVREYRRSLRAILEGAVEAWLDDLQT